VIKENVAGQIKDNSSMEKSLFTWAKKHNPQLLLASASTGVLILTILGIKNKDVINALWESINKMQNGCSLCNEKRVKNVTLDNLTKKREIVEADYLNTSLDLDYRSLCCDRLTKLDNAIGKLKWGGKEFGYPVSGSNGLYLPSDD